MHFASSLLALATALPALLASPLPTGPSAVSHQAQAQNKTTDVRLSSRSAPMLYSGPWQNFPSMDTWVSTFEELFDLNMESMTSNGNTESDISHLFTAVQDASSLGVDPRVIFAIIMQESHGNVGVGNTASFEALGTNGLMQCYKCAGFPEQHGLTQEQISEMVRGGTELFKEAMRNHGDEMGPRSVYPALREYNSGSVDESDLSNGLGATGSYVSDVAQRLQGWVG